MFSSLRTSLLPSLLSLPTLTLTELGAVSAEGVLANRQALLFPADRCWAEGCAASPAHLPQCGQCHTARFCGRECQTRAWPRHRSECQLYRQVQAAKAQQLAQQALAQ